MILKNIILYKTCIKQKAESRKHSLELTELLKNQNLDPKLISFFDYNLVESIKLIQQHQAGAGATVDG